MDQDALDYIGSKNTLTLATSGSDGPWAATLTYVNDDADVFVWTRPNSSSARHIDENPTVAFTIDEYTPDWRDTKGIQARGQCSVVQGEDVAKVADLFGRKFPELRPGATSAVVFYRISPTSLEYIDNSKGVDDPGDFGAEYRRQSVIDLETPEGA
jgi:uncharacterized protein